MFNKDWWSSKNKSKELTLGWLYNNNIQDDFAKGYTKNMTDYWAVEMSWFLAEQFEDDDIFNLCKKAHDAGFGKIIVLKQGTTLGCDFQTAFVSFYEANKNAKLVGHVLDYGDNYYTIHPQAFMLDLTWWASVGFPEWGDQISESFKTIEPTRSKENWHGEYTPHWIAPSKNLKTYTGKESGWNLIETLLKDGERVISWNQEMREAKHYSYPEVKYDGPRHLPGVMEQLGMDIFFIANTELPPLFDGWIKHRKTQYPSWDGCINRLVVPAAGLSPLIYAFILGMPKDGRIFIYDISPFALDITQRIIEEWDGTEYSKFAKRLMRDVAPTPSRRRDIFRGVDQLKHSDETINKLKEQGFKEWLNDVLPTLEIFYNPINIMDPNQSKRFVNVARNKLENKATYVHLSNIYHYMPTAFYYSLQQRWALHNELLDQFKSESIENNLLIYSACPVGYRGALNWADDWDTRSFDDALPDDNIGKLLKWNK